MTRAEKIIADVKALNKGRVIIAIDGPSAAGKTSLADELSCELDATVFHVDDFFVPLKDRADPVFREIGNNYDFLRFEKEIISPLKENREIKFRRFCCKTQALQKEEKVTPAGVVIIEGVYSAHPRFAEIFDLKYFIKIDKKTQKERIEKRNGTQSDRFFKEWIPLEDAYFEKFEIKNNCKII